MTANPTPAAGPSDADYGRAYLLSRTRALFSQERAEDFIEGMAQELAKEHESTAQPECTCPSGDGSLRHPCPQHSTRTGDGVDGATGVGGLTFDEWLAHEIPPGTVINDPAWWASKIKRWFPRQALATQQPVVNAVSPELSGESVSPQMPVGDCSCPQGHFTGFNEIAAACPRHGKPNTHEEPRSDVTPPAAVDELVRDWRAGVHEADTEFQQGWHQCLRNCAEELEAALATAKQGERVQGVENLPSPERGRYFASGPEGYFFTDDLKLATAILVAYDKDDDWTVTDLHNPYGIGNASGAGEG